MIGFQNVAPPGINDILYSFKPQYGNQWESGLKIYSRHQLLEATVSYYNINIRNTVIADQNDATKYIQGGRQYTRGVEIDIQTEPTKNLYLHGGAAYNNSKITEAEDSTKGLRPVNAGPT